MELYIQNPRRINDGCKKDMSPCPPASAKGSRLFSPNKIMSRLALCIIFLKMYVKTCGKSLVTLRIFLSCLHPHPLCVPRAFAFLFSLRRIRSVDVVRGKVKKSGGIHLWTEARVSRRSPSTGSEGPSGANTRANTCGECMNRNSRESSRSSHHGRSHMSAS